MPETKTEMVRRLLTAFNRRDLDALFAEVAPDALFDWSRSIGPQRGVYRHPGEARSGMEAFLEAWDEFSWTAEEVIEIDPERVLLVNRVRGRGKGSGVEVNARGVQLWTIREGKIAEVRLFQAKEDALRTVRRELRERARLYFVCEARPHGHQPDELLHAALRGGADIVQLREKEATSDAALIEAARPFREAAARHGALFILNDRPDLVAACGADGVHVGQEDMPVAEARRLAGPGAVVGLSTHSPDQIDAACTAEGGDRPDQISVGPVWATPTKEGRAGTGLGLIELAARDATVPWFAIGGIDTKNVRSVAAAGAERIVVVRAIRDADDPEGAARALREALEARVNAG